MKRLSVCIICFCLLAGCLPAEKGTLKLPAEQKTLTLAVPVNSDEITKNAVGIFADKVTELTENNLVIEVQEVSDPYEELKNGLALIPISRLASVDSRLEMLTYPFFFDSVDHMSMSLNSPQNLELLTKIIPDCSSTIGTLYTTSTILLTNKKYYDELGVETHIVSLQSSRFKELFEKLKAREVFAESYGTSIQRLLDKEVSAIEATFSQLKSIPPRDVKLNIIPTRHYIYGDMLMLGSQAEGKLNDFHKAAIYQAFCHALGYNDNARKQGENSITEGRYPVSLMLYQGSMENFRRSAESILYIDLDALGWNREVYSALRSTGK